MKAHEEVTYLYKNDKLFKKMFDFMFNEWGWAATEVEKDCLKLYKLVKKYS